MEAILAEENENVRLDMEEKREIVERLRKEEIEGSK